MFFEHRAFWLPKDVAHDDEYQDAYQVDGFRGVAAIADGVSSSLFAASWAKILANAVVADLPDVNDFQSLGPWLARQREKWTQPINADALPWHQKARLQAGAFSTLLWVELNLAVKSDPAATGSVEMYVYAIGDCCLFHVRDDFLLRSFPIGNSQLFDAEPAVIGSASKQKDHLLKFETLNDYTQPGDLLVLCTDAVAAWALAQHEAGRSPRWSTYWDLPPEKWKQEVIALRQEHLMRYDDATLLLLRVT